MFTLQAILLYIQLCFGVSDPDQVMIDDTAIRMESDPYASEQVYYSSGETTSPYTDGSSSYTGGWDTQEIN